MGKFVISERTNGKYQFVLKAGNGEIILVSEEYSAKVGCQTGIASVRVNAPIDYRYDRLRSRNDKYYFNLKAGNGEIIGSSEMYETNTGRDKGIESVKNNAPTATVDDQT